MQSFHSFQTLNIFKFLIFFLKRKKKIPVSSCRTTTSRQQKYKKKKDILSHQSSETGTGRSLDIFSSFSHGKLIGNLSQDPLVSELVNKKKKENSSSSSFGVPV
jgi:hypothetical protein